MSRSVLITAQSLLKKRRFTDTVKLLEGSAEHYGDNFDYYLTLGIACLYLGDTGSANNYFSRARSIRLTDTQLLLGQAALYLRRGETDRALQYYLDIQDNEPGNKIVAKAMEFIRTKGDYKTINRWVETGKIKRFYPPLGINPSIVQRCLLLFLLCGMAGIMDFLLRSCRVLVNRDCQVNVPLLKLLLMMPRRGQKALMKRSTLH